MPGEGEAGLALRLRQECLLSLLWSEDAGCL